MTTIGFICTGNTCRSPMAECYFRFLIKGNNDIEVFSAGVGAGYGWRVSEESCMVMSQYNLSMKDYISKPLTDELVKKADMLIVMTDSHKAKINLKWPEVKNKVYLLREFDKNVNDEDLNIFDPVGCPYEVYEKCFNLMKSSLEHLGEIVCKKL